MSNSSEIIHIESFRKQLLKQIEVLDNEITNLNRSVKQKGLEINSSQIENAINIGKYQSELKASEIEVALLQKWLELINSGVDPKSIDLEQLKLDVIEDAQSAQDSFENNFLDLKEMTNANEGMVAISNRLGKRFFSPNLHLDTYKDKDSIEAQLQLNTTMSEPELAGSVFTDIFPKTLKQLLKSDKLNESQRVVVSNLFQKYNSFIEKGNLSDVELGEILNTIKSDYELKLIFKQSPDLKPVLNTTLKEIILDIELPEGKPVVELKEIIIRKKSEITFLQKKLESVDDITTKEGQDKILDINEQYFKQIQELKDQIAKLNLEIKEKVQSYNIREQQELEEMKAKLEKMFVESVKPETESTAIASMQTARSEIINTNFEAEQKEYKEKLMKLPSLIYEQVKKAGKFGKFKLHSMFNVEEIITENFEANLSINELSLTTIDRKLCKEHYIVMIHTLENLVDITINEDYRMRFKELSYIHNVEKQELSKYFFGDQSLKNAYKRIKTILKRDFDIDIDNLEGKCELTESSSTNLIENQET